MSKNSDQKYNRAILNKGPEAELAETVVNKLIKDKILDKKHGKLTALAIVTSLHANQDINIDIYENNGKVFDQNLDRISDSIYDVISTKIKDQNNKETSKMSSLEFDNEILIKDQNTKESVLTEPLKKAFSKAKELSQNIENNLTSKKPDKILGIENKAQKILGIEEASKSNPNFKSQLKSIKKDITQAFKNIKNDISSHLPSHNKSKGQGKD
ncbi:MAG: hypothetical protein ACK4OM_05975 [Alphaproteobacteria bacterium]